ncbi:MAG TPA: hypothetical protein VHH36_01570 [Candidatus Thermoplasmatota archaeon]|nr:hypothetical protein [Candidatus Thermoplasmatota archaeon]
MSRAVGLRLAFLLVAGLGFLATWGFAMTVLFRTRLPDGWGAVAVVGALLLAASVPVLRAVRPPRRVATAWQGVAAGWLAVVALAFGAAVNRELFGDAAEGVVLFAGFFGFLGMPAAILLVALAARPQPPAEPPAFGVS